MCEILGIGQTWWSVVGLLADFIGVGLLGFDLVRLQRFLRTHAGSNLRFLEEVASDYGGIEGWADEIRKSSDWVPEHAYSRTHAEDEVSYNARRATEQIEELATCLNGLAENVSKLVLLHSEQAEKDAAAAGRSVRISILGLSIIAIGFAMQIVGTWPC